MDVAATAKSISAARRRFLILAAVVGLLVYLGIAISVDGQRLQDGIRRLGFGDSAVVLGLSLLNYVLRCGRWNFYLGALGHRIPIMRQAAYYFGGFAFTVSPGKSGEAVRALYLARHGVPFSDCVAALFSERLIDLLAICVLLALTVARLHIDGKFAIATLSLTFAGTWLLSRPHLPLWLGERAQRLPGKIGRATQHLAKILRASAHLLTARRLYPALMIGLLAWGAEGYAFYLICHGLHIASAPAAGIAIYSIAVLGGAAAFVLPAGLGGFEAAMGALLVAAGASLDNAFVATVLCRFATLWFAVLLGVAAVLAIEISGAVPAAAEVR